MRWRLLLLVSLIANVLLALGWLTTRHPAPSAPAREPAVTNPATIVRTNFLFRRQFFTWSEIESPDYYTYVANLRDIACPEQTIRDIIIADVNALYARRRAVEVLTPEQQWWRAAPDPAVQATATAKLRELEDERRALLTQLLGSGWDGGDQISLPRPTRPGLNLDGPLLGNLSPDVKQALQEIAARTQDRLQAYLEAQRKEGRPADPVELAKLRAQNREELARLLSPPELEEFLLRFSQNAAALRAELAQLRFFNLAPEEFRQLFRARDNYDLRLALLGDATDPATAQQRDALEQQRDLAVKLALGEKRYAEYVRLHDNAYREAYAQANQAGAPEAAGTLFEIRQVIAEEQQRIRENPDLTDDQKAIELKRIELEQLKANLLALGKDLPPEPPPPPTPTRDHNFHLGDTLIGLALRYDVSVSTIVSANPGVDFNRLKIGDTLKIPVQKR